MKKLSFGFPQSYLALILGLIALTVLPSAAVANSGSGPHRDLRSAQAVRERPPVSSRRADPDRDGLATTTEERRTKTNPRKFDTDGDGFGDGAELLAKTNPRNHWSVPTGPPAPTAPTALTVAVVSPSKPKSPTKGHGPKISADSTAPDTTISSGPLGTTTDTTASFDFSSSEDGSTYRCAIDSGSWSSCSSPKSYGSVAVGSHSFAVKATDAAGNTDASPASRSWTVEATPTPTPPADSTCTQTLASGASLSSAISSASGGAVICLSSGSYSVNVTKANKSSMVTVKPAAGAAPTLAYSMLNQATNLRFRELKFTGGIEALGPASNIQLIDNEFVGPFGFHSNGQQASNGSKVTDVLITGNNMHNLDYTGNQGTANGYGITASNGVARFTITGNTIKSPASDYIQFASPDTVVIDHNTFLGPSLLGSHQDHQDLVQIFGGGDNVTFTNNVARNTETQESLLFQEGSFSNVVVENNLFDHDSRGYTCQIYQSDGLVFRNNTIVGSHWGCLFRDLASSAAGSGYQIDHNVFTNTAEGSDISTEGRAGSWGAYDYNVSEDGSASGAHSVRNWSPSWSDTTSYTPLGLSFTAGYLP